MRMTSSATQTSEKAMIVWVPEPEEQAQELDGNLPPSLSIRGYSHPSGPPSRPLMRVIYSINGSHAPVLTQDEGAKPRKERPPQTRTGPSLALSLASWQQQLCKAWRSNHQTGSVPLLDRAVKRGGFVLAASALQRGLALERVYLIIYWLSDEG